MIDLEAFKYSGRLNRLQYINLGFFWNISGQSCRWFLDKLPEGSAAFWIAILIALISAVNNICIAIRRMHDIDRKGWRLFLMLIPIIGAIMIFIDLLRRGTEGDNRFGPPPRASTTKDYIFLGIMIATALGFTIAIFSFDPSYAKTM